MQQHSQVNKTNYISQADNFLVFLLFVSSEVCHQNTEKKKKKLANKSNFRPAAACGMSFDARVKMCPC